jgi:hypothetical protein
MWKARLWSDIKWLSVVLRLISTQHNLHAEYCLLIFQMGVRNLKILKCVYLFLGDQSSIPKLIWGRVDDGYRRLLPGGIFRSMVYFQRLQKPRFTLERACCGCWRGVYFQELQCPAWSSFKMWWCEDCRHLRQSMSRDATLKMYSPLRSLNMYGELKIASSMRLSTWTWVSWLCSWEVGDNSLRATTRKSWF